MQRLSSCVFSTIHTPSTAPSAAATVNDVDHADSPPNDEMRQSNRMLIFVGIFSLVLLLSTLFVSLTFRQFTGIDGWLPVALPLVATLGFVPGMLLGFRLRHPLLTGFYRVSATALAVLNFTLIAAISCWLTAGVVAVLQVSIPLRTLAFAFYGFAAAVTLYGWINARRIRITRSTVALPRLSPAWQGRTLALVSDIHLGNVRGATFVSRIVNRLTSLSPDLILIAGDMFDGARVDQEAIGRAWGNLKAPQGVYFASGNHDEFADRTPFLATLSRAGIRVLHNEKTELPDGLQLIGVHDGEAGDITHYRSILENLSIDRSRASILLTHQPSNLDIPESAGVSLQVSGHTHRGQFWPWTHIVNRVHGPFAYGLNQFRSLQVFTSSGIGTWGPPIRVGTRSEIVLIKLEAGA